MNKRNEVLSMVKVIPPLENFKYPFRIACLMLDTAETTGIASVALLDTMSKSSWMLPAKQQYKTMS